MIYLFSDYIEEAGGLETYLHALSLRLLEDDLPFRVAVAEMEHCPLLDELEKKGVDVYRQGWIPGDRWDVRHHVLLEWLRWQLEPGDWVYCLRQPLPRRFLKTVRMAHSQGAKIAASWRMAPALMGDLASELEDDVKQAVEELDVVVSVSECTVDQYRDRYDYEGPVEVVRYHNLPFFEAPVPMPDGPPWRIGYMGRLSIAQKNLDTLLNAFRQLCEAERDPVELHFHGSGGDRDDLDALARQLDIRDRVSFHGRYDHRTDLPDIVADTHFFVYTSRFEGGPCFTLLELLQAGRYVVASAVGGIPDLYDGHPEAGRLVSPDDEDDIANTLTSTLQDIRKGHLDEHAVRRRYENEFDMEAAHQGWRAALDLEPQMNGASAERT